jgi:hypothetical protein
VDDVLGDESMIYNPFDVNRVEGSESEPLTEADTFAPNLDPTNVSLATFEKIDDQVPLLRNQVLDEHEVSSTTSEAAIPESIREPSPQFCETGDAFAVAAEEKPLTDVINVGSQDTDFLQIESVGDQELLTADPECNVHSSSQVNDHLQDLRVLDFEIPLGSLVIVNDKPGVLRYIGRLASQFLSDTWFFKSLHLSIVYFLLVL